MVGFIRNTMDQAFFDVLEEHGALKLVDAFLQGSHHDAWRARHCVLTAEDCIEKHEHRNDKKDAERREAALR